MKLHPCQTVELRVFLIQIWIIYINGNPDALTRQYQRCLSFRSKWGKTLLASRVNIRPPSAVLGIDAARWKNSAD